MRYCVIKDTTTVIDGSINKDEVLLLNALHAGFTNKQVEILTQEQYSGRKKLEAKPAPQPTQEEILSAKIENQTINLLIDLGVV